MEQPNFKNLEELKNWIINVHEKDVIEMKRARELPAAFWESYSAFCNTSGGWILIGVCCVGPRVRSGRSLKGATLQHSRIKVLENISIHAPRRERHLSV